MTKHRFSAPAGVLIGIGLLLFMTGAFEAITTIVDPATGDVLTVDVVTDPQDPTLQGVLYQQQSAGGGVSSETIADFDLPEDADPVIGLAPDSSVVVVVWSRHDGEDFELAMARRTPGQGWDPFSVITENELPDSRPRLTIGPNHEANILWWGNGAGGPVYLQSFNPATRRPLSPRHRPFETAPSRRLTPTLENDAGGMDDPGVPARAAYSKASATPCAENPEAEPDHGVLMACDRAAAFQVTNCYLMVGTRSLETDTWSQILVDLRSVNLSSMTPREIAQGVANGRCEAP